SADLRVLLSFPTRRSSDLSVYWRRPTSSWPPDTLVALAARLATSGTLIPSPAARARSSVMRTLSGGPAFTSTAATPGIASSRERSEEHTSELQSPDHLVCR